MIRLLMPMMLTLFISACGKTGPLYLPDAEQGAVSDKTPANSSMLNGTEANRGSL